MTKLQQLMAGKKIEQIAIAVNAADHERISRTLQHTFNLDRADDHVKGLCKLPQNHWQGFESLAHLTFLYGLGFELEILTYENLPNWHQLRLMQNGFVNSSQTSSHRPFLSHMGLHVENVEEWERAMAEEGFFPIQTLNTTEHTNPYLLEKGRKFRYVIFDTFNSFGFDLKVIERIERKANESQA